jgi:paraquat-inducible protein A
VKYPSGTAAAKGLALCHTCHLLSPVEHGHCERCDAHLHLRKTDSLNRTVALLITAIVLYIPANVLPIMNTVQLGASEPATILGGVVILLKMKSYPIAAVIFIASIMVPVSKFIAITYLVFSVRHHRQYSARQRTVIYRFTEFVGRWSMVDVFVVSILVALVRLQGILTIEPGSAALAFAGVVVVTMISAQSFDVRLVWDNRDEVTEEAAV